MIGSRHVQSSLTELRAARAQYAQVLERIDAAIVALERVAESAQLTPTNQTITGAQASGRAESLKTPRGAKPPGFRRMRYRTAIAQVLRRHSPKALSTREIIEALGEGGRKIKGKNSYKTVYQAMKASPQFHNNRGKWTLAEVPATSEQVAIAQ